MRPLLVAYGVMSFAGVVWFAVAVCREVGDRRRRERARAARHTDVYDHFALWEDELRERTP